MLLLLDNYDSFTYNLLDYLCQLESDCMVIRNDEVGLEEVIAMKPRAIVLSPGPKTPEDAGIMMDLIRHFYDKVPLLGICLGFQGIGQFFGAKLAKARAPVHGKTAEVYHNGSPMFEEIPNPFRAMRYHSLILKDLELTSLEITARTEDGVPMAIEHPEWPVCGLQFHPEAWLTQNGILMLKNWLTHYKTPLAARDQPVL